MLRALLNLMAGAAFIVVLVRGGTAVRLWLIPDGTNAFAHEEPAAPPLRLGLIP